MAVRTSMVMGWMQREGKMPYTSDANTTDEPDRAWLNAGYSWEPYDGDEESKLPGRLYKRLPLTDDADLARIYYPTDANAIAALEAALDATSGWDREPGTIHGRMT